MPIDFVCSCGKHMRAKEAFAGRKIKCPQCDMILRIPRLEPMRAPVLTDQGSASRVAKPVLQSAASGARSMGDTSMLTAPPMARKVVAQREPDPVDLPDEASVHAWIDRSLAQKSTPWLPGDEEVFQKDVKKPREGWSVWEMVGLGLGLIAGSAVVVWLLVAH